MGEPATPSPADRAETRKLAAAIVDSVRADERMPIDARFEHIRGRKYYRADEVEQLAFRLAQEVEQLAADLQRERTEHHRTLSQLPED